MDAAAARLITFKLRSNKLAARAAPVAEVRLFFQFARDYDDVPGDDRRSHAPLHV